MRVIGLLLISTFLSVGIAKAQTNDEVRAATGLPVPISGRATLTPQIGVDVSGSVIIDGEGEQTPNPEMVVYVVSQTNLAFVFGRQRIRNKGSFRVEAVPTGMMTLVLEIGGKEFARYPLNSGASQNIRQDISLTWSQVNEKLEKLGVVDARTTYSRTRKNQDLFDKAMDQKRAGKSEQAISSLGKLTKDDPNDYIAANELGNLLFEVNPSRAEESYRNAFAERPDLTFALINLGKLQFNQKQFDASIETFNKVLAIDDKSADAYHFLGENHLAIRKGSLAVGFLNKALELAPIEKAELHLRLGALYNAANLRDRAADEYRAFLAKVPDYDKRKDLEQYIEANTAKQ
jgi:tetratricopeptide (TPR) repeat protein